MAKTDNTLIISDEQSAVLLLEQLLQDDIDIDFSSVQFKGWGDFTIRLTGEKFDNSLTPTVMRGIIELQQALYRSYALAVYNDENPNRLTKQERQQLELRVEVKKGSSLINIDVDQAIGEILTAAVSKMSSGHLLAAIILIGILFFGKTVWVRHIEKSQAIKEKELENDNMRAVLEQMNKQTQILQEGNQKTLDVLEKAIKEIPQSSQLHHIANQAQHELLRSTKYADTVNIDQAVEMTGESAEYFTQSARKTWQNVRLDGKYRLLKVDSTNVRERKVHLENVTTKDVFWATLTDESMDKKHINNLSNAEWSLHPVGLQIAAKSLDGKLKDAQIIGVEQVDTSISFKSDLA